MPGKPWANSVAGKTMLQETIHSPSSRGLGSAPLAETEVSKPWAGSHESPGLRASGDPLLPLHPHIPVCHPTPQSLLLLHPGTWPPFPLPLAAHCPLLLDWFLLTTLL